MSNLFHYDSPLIKKLTLLANLAGLNILWLICCIPVFTIGAATTAMHTVLFRYLENKDDNVIHPFFKAFSENFKQATGLWMICLPVIVLLVIDALFLYGNHSGMLGLLWIPFAIVTLVLSIVMTYTFPLLARYDSPIKQIIHNSLILFLMDLWKSLFVIILNFIPLAVLIFLPNFCLRTAFFWLCFGGSLFSYWNDRILLQIFNKRQYKADAEENTTQNSVC